jgi:DsbC/DsbD-like thiol-disulfide interchange protein
LRTTRRAQQRASFDSAATTIEFCAIQTSIMKRMNRKLVLTAFLISLFVASVPRAATAPAPEPNISVVGYFATDKAQKGKPVRIAVVIDVPAGYHINSNRPLESYLIATSVKVEAENGLRGSAVSYPRPVLRTFKFSNKQLSVYEGQARLKFSVPIPANYSDNSAKIKARVRLQSCNDEVCFPPKTYDVDLKIDVVSATERVRATNGWAFK